MSKKSYISFHGEINTENATKLIFYCDNLMREGTEHIYISISSRGGYVDSELHLYNTLRAMDVEITMHNTGSVKSAGMLVFLAADNRFASENSRFLIHQPVRKYIGDPKSYDARDLSEHAQLLENDMLHEKKILLQHTKATKKDINSWHKNTKVFTPAEAKKYGIISEVREFVVPKRDKIFTVATTTL